MSDADAARAAVEIIKTKLQHVVNAIMKPDPDTGRVPQDRQRAIRIVESRQRMVEREWLRCYGSEQQREDSTAELLLGTDDGTLVFIGEKKHSRGRLNCRACSLKLENGLMTRTSHICPVCRKGVVHSYVVQHSVEETASPVIEPQAGPPPQATMLPWDNPVSMFSPADLRVYMRFFECEHCHNRQSIELTEDECNEG